MFIKSENIAALFLPLVLCSLTLAQNSSEAQLHFDRGESFLSAKKYEDAIREFQQAIRLNPKWPEAYFRLGAAYSAIPVVSGGSGENSKAALDAFERAVHLKPNWPEALTELGSKYTTFLQYDKAMSCLQRAITLKPDVAASHLELAIVYLYIGHYTEAVDSLKQATSFRPELALPHKLLGLVYLVLDDRDKALEEYKVLQSLNKDMATYLKNAMDRTEKPTFGVFTGKLISVPVPDYPAAARTQGIFGNVTVEVTINEKGRVTSARSLNGPPELRAAAEAAALKARFTPTKLSGMNVSVKGIITFQFKS